MNYLITFRCYGTWLHGDKRGSVDRFHNQPGEAFLEPDEKLESYRRQLQKGTAMHFDMNARKLVDATIREVAQYRGWKIQELNVLSNHVHAVVTASDDVTPEKIMNNFKARSTRLLREQGRISSQAPVWEYHGSTRWLNSEEAVEMACRYVREQNEPEHYEPRA
jgi:REP element-mobilizing transposase RayT